MGAVASTVVDMTLTAPAKTAIGSDRVGFTAVTALAPLVWGTTYLTTTEMLPPDHPAFAAAMRAVPAGLVALLIARQLPRGIWWFRSLVIGTLNIGIFFPLLFVSAERLPGGVAATVGAIQPLVVAGLAITVLREPASTWRLGWGLAGFAGVSLVVLGPDAGLDPVGVAAGIAGAASMALGVTLAKRWGWPAGVSAIGFAGWQLTSAGVVLVPLSVLEGPPPDIDAHAVTGYLWLGSWADSSPTHCGSAASADSPSQRSRCWDSCHRSSPPPSAPSCSARRSRLCRSSASPLGSPRSSAASCPSRGPGSTTAHQPNASARKE